MELFNTNLFIRLLSHINRRDEQVYYYINMAYIYIHIHIPYGSTLKTIIYYVPLSDLCIFFSGFRTDGLACIVSILFCGPSSPSDHNIMTAPRLINDQPFDVVRIFA